MFEQRIEIGISFDLLTWMSQIENVPLLPANVFMLDVIGRELFLFPLQNIICGTLDLSFHCVAAGSNTSRMEDQANRPHRKSKAKNKSTSGSNPKAFAFAAPGRLKRDAARSSEIKEKRLHVPLVDRLPEETPPLIVAVVGPSGVREYTPTIKAHLMSSRLVKRLLSNL